MDAGRLSFTKVQVNFAKNNKTKIIHIFLKVLVNFAVLAFFSIFPFPHYFDRSICIFSTFMIDCKNVENDDENFFGVSSRKPISTFKTRIANPARL